MLLSTAAISTRRIHYHRTQFLLTLYSSFFSWVQADLDLAISLGYLEVGLADLYPLVSCSCSVFYGRVISISSNSLISAMLARTANGCSRRRRSLSSCSKRIDCNLWKFLSLSIQSCLFWLGALGTSVPSPSPQNFAMMQTCRLLDVSRLSAAWMSGCLTLYSCWCLISSSQVDPLLLDRTISSFSDGNPLRRALRSERHFSFLRPLLNPYKWFNIKN